MIDDDFQVFPSTRELAATEKRSNVRFGAELLQNTTLIGRQTKWKFDFRKPLRNGRSEMLQTRLFGILTISCPIADTEFI